MASRFLHDPKYALMYGLLALLLLLSGGLLFREAGQLRERAEGMATENPYFQSPEGLRPPASKAPQRQYMPAGMHQTALPDACSCLR